MRAVVCEGFGSVDDLGMGELPDPTPGPGEAVLAMEIAGVNFPDTLIVEGKYQVRPEPPFAPGFEGVGMVESVGDGAGVEIGTRVIAAGVFGSFAEKWLVEAGATVPVPAWMDAETAAGFGVTYGTSYYALKQRARLQPGESLLVLGAAGGVGSSAVDLGAAMGARVLAAVGSDDKRSFVRDLGAEEVINYETEDLTAAVKELTGGAGVDVVVDPVGGAHTEAAVRATAWEGRALVIGFTAGEIPRIPTNLTLLKGMSIVGVFWGGWATRDPASSAANFAELFAMVEAGTIAPRIHATFELEEFAQALELIRSRRVTGKVLLRVAS